MSNEEVRKHVEAFFDSLHPVEDQLFQAYLARVMEIQKDGNPVPLHILGSGLAMIAYRTAMAFQHNLRLDADKPVPQGHIIGAFVEGINNACVAEHAMIGISLKPAHLELLCTLLERSEHLAAPTIRMMMEQQLEIYKPLIVAREAELAAQAQKEEQADAQEGGDRSDGDCDG